MKDDEETTQAEILDAKGISHENGICSATTNTFLRSIFKKNLFHLRGDRKMLHKKIVGEQLRQNQLLRDGDDADHSGFVKTQTPYEVKVVNTQAIVAGKDLLQILGNSQHSLLKFQSGLSYHQIYFGRMNLNRCRLFDPNVRGGIKIKNCEDLASETVKKIQKQSQGLGQILIGKSK